MGCLLESHTKITESLLVHAQHISMLIQCQESDVMTLFDVNITVYAFHKDSTSSLACLTLGKIESSLVAE